jgi:triosephosphate isomerase
MRKPVLAGNWKMYKGPAAAVALASAIRDGCQDALADREVVVAPPFVSIAAVANVLKGGHIGLAAQNAHFEQEGAFTGEVATSMLREAGCSHAILGHSERRQLFGETDEGVAKKAAATLAHALVPIICVGETLAEREGNETTKVVERQTERALRDLRPEQVAGLLVAYEPVWAIGTGKTATPAQAERSTPSSAHWSPRPTARRPPMPSASSTAEASSPTTSRRSWRRQTSTGPSSVARR